MDLLCSCSSSTAVISKTQPRVSRSSHEPIHRKPHYEKHRKSSAENQNDDVRRHSSAELNDLYKHSAGSSRRHLLGEASFIDWVSQSDQIPPIHTHHSHPSLCSSSSSSSSARSRNQEVNLRVSLHCKACAAKVRKHISKMEGVTSFNIDLETKKVTIMGDVTPLGVLASVSKVKPAQLWSSSSSSRSK